MDEIYAEVYTILKLLGNTYVSKISNEIYLTICKHKNNNYKVRFNSLESISEENCTKETISIIALFHLKYWCDSENEKNSLNTIINENTIKNNELKRFLYNPNMLLKKF